MRIWQGWSTCLWCKSIHWSTRRSTWLCAFRLLSTSWQSYSGLVAIPVVTSLWEASPSCHLNRSSRFLIAGTCWGCLGISYTCAPNFKGRTDTGSPIDKALPSSGMQRCQGIKTDVAFRVIQNSLLFVPLPLGGVHQLLQVLGLVLRTISAP